MADTVSSLLVPWFCTLSLVLEYHLRLFCFLKFVVTVIMHLSYYSMYMCPLGLYDE